MNLYALHDWDEKLKAKFGAFWIDESQANNFNCQGYGIMFSPNEFNGKRKKENLIKINYWFADIDNGAKEEQMILINKLMLKPSKIIESKRGYHLYWKAIDGSIENFRLISEGIIKKLSSDQSIKEPCHLMRYPGYYHMKDKDNPFLVTLISENQEEYTEKEMLYAFEYKKPVRVKKYQFETNNKSDLLNPDKWNRIFKLDNFGNGNRNNNFARIVFWLRDSGIPSYTVKETIFEMNRRIKEPLPDNEIESILRGKL